MATGLSGQHLNTLRVRSMSSRGVRSHSEPGHMLMRLAREVEGIRGVTDPATLSARDDVAGGFREAGDIQQAILYEEESLQRRLDMKASEGALEDESTSNNRMRLARDYSEVGNFTKAVRQLYAVLRNLEAHDPPNWERITETRNDLAFELLRKGDYSTAVDLGKTTLDRTSLALGTDHPALITTRHNMAAGQEKSQKFEEACQLYEKNKAILESIDSGARESQRLDEALGDTNKRLRACRARMKNRLDRRNSVGRLSMDQQVNGHGRTEVNGIAENGNYQEGIQHQGRDERNERRERRRLRQQESSNHEACGRSRGPTSDRNKLPTVAIGDSPEDGSALRTRMPAIQGTRGRDVTGVNTPTNENAIATPQPQSRLRSNLISLEADAGSQKGPERATHLQVPGAWPPEPDDAAGPCQDRRSVAHLRNAQSMGVLRLYEPENHSTTIVDTRPSRPASAADVERPLYNVNRNGFRPSDRFFMELEQHTHKLLDKYQDGIDGISKRAVKIAILDTGIARHPPEVEPPDIKYARARIKFGARLKNRLSPREDEDGHGTHCAGILLKVCPYADLYVYRISRGMGDELDHEVVAEALNHAVDKNKVDVVSMSFGWRDNSSEELRKALEHAKQEKVLMFAAASNEGRDMAFPARADEVIAVDAASSTGNALHFNPRETGDRSRFTALGEHVLAAWPKLPKSDQTGFARMTGTSSATPIAAATAALIIEFARQPPCCFDPEIEQRVKERRCMQRILQEVVCKKKEIFSDFNHIDITLLLRVNSLFEDGGEWSSSFSPRQNAAVGVVNILAEEYGPDVSRNLSDAITAYQKRQCSQS